MAKEDFDQYPGVKYTSPAKGGPNIEFFTTTSSSSAWTPPTVAPGQTCSFQLLPYNSSDQFDFMALSFWGRMEDDIHKKLITNVVRSFHGNQGGSSAKFDTSKFGGQGPAIFVDNVDTHKTDAVSFAVVNNNDTKKDGYISLQVTIADKKSKEQYTSADPEIPVPKG